MRIVVVHSRYRSSQPSGENVTVDSQCNQLRAAGHQVLEILEDSDRLGEDPASKVKAGLRLLIGAGASPIREISEFDADIIHVHNNFPNFSARWTRDLERPFVATLHNYRYACAAGTFYRDGAPCYECLEKGPLSGLRHGCYRNSRVASIPMALSVSNGADRNETLKRAYRLITLSSRAREMHIRAGIPLQRLAVVPNFREAAPCDIHSSPTDGFAYVGRLSPEKGIYELVKNWPASRRLDIYGDGPLRHEIEWLASSSIRVHGAIPPSEVQQRLRMACALVFPSLWSESAYPMSYLDALSIGVPVVAIAGNSAADDIEEFRTGITFDTWNSIEVALEGVSQHRASLSANALHRYTAAFTPERWTSSIEALYHEAIAGRERTPEG